jgi:hypothetical protein
MSCLRIENLFDGPRKCPEYVPVFVSLGFLPASLLEVLD